MSPASSHLAPHRCSFSNVGGAAPVQRSAPAKAEFTVRAPCSCGAAHVLQLATAKETTFPAPQSPRLPHIFDATSRYHLPMCAR
jgi:hypothetical protein